MRSAKVRRGAKRKPSTLAQDLYEGLCREITTGKLKPGELLSRRKIAANYGTSYIPVVEAMVRLENVGLIESESAQMARVSAITVEGIEHACTLREALETQAIRLACESATDQEIAALYQLAEAVEARTSQWDASHGNVSDGEGPVLHFRFHHRIAEISRCPTLVRELEKSELAHRLRANWIYVAGMHDVPRFHSLLADAIKARDPQAADAAMRSHVRFGLAKELRGYRVQATKPGNENGHLRVLPPDEPSRQGSKTINVAAARPTPALRAVGATRTVTST
ncbi:MAG TPA: GntR family transcriptional regulator [Pirellulales bacterium]|jgi:DNA-binding GntR family transcriptional regulator|nr:GntR family transcriptional regulator [Pirellulales bacterium]